MQQQVLGSMRYSKKSRGRALAKNIPELRLQKGDRLEPTKLLWDVGMFGNLAPPFLVTFWRGSKQSRLIHMCPLFDILGVTVESWVADLMHSWHLGDLLMFIACAIWFVILSGIFAPVSADIKAEDCHRASLLRIKSKMYDHYGRMRKDKAWRHRCSEVLNKAL